MNPSPSRLRGFTLLPVMLTMSLIAAVAFTLNRDNGVNAVMVSNQQDEDRARFAAEAGLQAVNADVQAHSCGGGFPVAGTPVVDNSFGGASYSAYATSAGGNTTGLVSTGAFNGTTVTLTRSTVYVYQSTPKTYTLQPDPATGLDTYIDSKKEENFGNDAGLILKKSDKIALLKFDLSAFPAGSRPLSATLSIHASGAVPDRVDFYRVIIDWAEGTGAKSPLDGATWNTRNGSVAWTPGGNVHPASLNATAITIDGTGWVNLDATQITTAWLEGRYPNQGVLIKAADSNGTSNFTSSDGSTATERPKITFSYLLPCGTTGPEDTPGGTVTLAATADSFNDSGAATANNGRATNLKVYFTPTRENRIPISFDVRTVPAGSVIKSAVLRMYVSAVASATTNSKSIWANAIAESWVEGSGANTSKSCPTATAGTSWNYRTDCTSWTTVHPPDTPQSWTAMATMPTARTGHSVTVVNGKIYAIGGINGSGYLNTVEEYDPSTNSWATKAAMPTRRSEAAAAVVNGKIYVMGGTNGTIQNKNEEYNPATNTWASKTAMPTGRANLSAVSAGGKIYALGGTSATAPGKVNQEYDPATNTWTTRASMLTARMWFAGQSVGGKVYALGGYTGSAGITNTEVYDPGTNTWKATAPLPIATDSMASAALGNRIYMFSGFQGSVTVKSVTAYDTVNNSFSSLLGYPIGANEPAAGVVSDRIYVMGGDTTTGTYYGNHYKFDPGVATPLATAVDEATSASPLDAGFTKGWITFDLTAVVQEWVDGIRPNNGVVIYAEGADQFSINSRESPSRTPELVVTY